MRLTELSPRQRDQRATVLQTLTAAGWTGHVQNDLFEQGFWLDSEATLDYENAQAHLSVMYSAEEQSIELLIDQDYRLDFVIAFGERLPQVLEAIVAFQERLSFQNVAQEMASLLQICPSGLYIYSEGTGRVLVDADLLADL
jgi:hypothetical protein